MQSSRFSLRVASALIQRHRHAPPYYSLHDFFQIFLLSHVLFSNMLFSCQLHEIFKAVLWLLISNFIIEQLENMICVYGFFFLEFNQYALRSPCSIFAIILCMIKNSIFCIWISNSMLKAWIIDLSIC